MAEPNFDEVQYKTSIITFINFYREHGFTVIPVEFKGKIPLVKWQKLRDEGFVPDSETVKKWFAKYGIFNIAIADKHVVEIDVDVPLPEDLLEEFKQRTWVIRSGKGHKILFRVKQPYTSWVAIAKEPDIRVKGNVIVVPPSIHESGVQYRFESCDKLEEVEKAEDLIPIARKIAEAVGAVVEEKLSVEETDDEEKDVTEKTVRVAIEGDLKAKVEQITEVKFDALPICVKKALEVRSKTVHEHDVNVFIRDFFMRLLNEDCGDDWQTVFKLFEAISPPDEFDPEITEKQLLYWFSKRYKPCNCENLYTDVPTLRGVCEECDLKAAVKNPLVAYYKNLRKSNSVPGVSDVPDVQYNENVILTSKDAEHAEHPEHPEHSNDTTKLPCLENAIHQRDTVALKLWLLFAKQRGENLEDSADKFLELSRAPLTTKEVLNTIKWVRESKFTACEFGEVTNLCEDSCPLKTDVVKRICTDTQEVVIVDSSGTLELRIRNHSIKVEKSKLWKKRKVKDSIRVTPNIDFYINLYINLYDYPPTRITEDDCLQIYNFWMKKAYRIKEPLSEEDEIFETVLAILIELPLYKAEELDKSSPNIGGFVNGDPPKELLVVNDLLLKRLEHKAIKTTYRKLRVILKDLLLRVERKRIGKKIFHFWVFSIPAIKAYSRVRFGEDWKPEVIDTTSNSEDLNPEVVDFYGYY